MSLLVKSMLIDYLLLNFVQQLNDETLFLTYLYPVQSEQVSLNF